MLLVLSLAVPSATQVAGQFHCDAVTGYEELLEREDMDAVYMPLPTGLHEEWCTKALHADKHVLVEKSFAADYESAERMVLLARRRNSLVVENFQFQTHRQWAAIRDRMHSGELGEIHLVRSTFGFPPLPKENFRWNKSLGGGALLDAGAYTTKAAQLLLGTGLEVLGASLQFDPDAGVDAYGEAMFRNASGQVAQVAFGFDYFYQCRVELLGTKGKLSTNRVFTAPPEFEPTMLIETPKGAEEVSLPADNHYVKMWKEFAKEVQSGEYNDLWKLLLDQARLIDRVREVGES